MKKSFCLFYCFKNSFNDKCVNVLSDNNATVKCPMCLKTTHDIPDVNCVPNENNLKYGLGLLHCEIKSFDHLKNISYKLELQTWNVKKHMKIYYFVSFTCRIYCSIL